MAEGIRVTTRILVRRDRVSEIVDQLRAGRKEAVDDVADTLRDHAYYLAPVDTGALRESLYISNGDESDYETRIGAAQELNDNMEALDEITPEFVISISVTPTKETYMTVVGAGAHYAIFQEEGTVFQPPQSFMVPAAEGTGADLETNMREILASLG